MKLKKQYVWITVVCILAIIVSGICGIFMYEYYPSGSIGDALNTIQGNEDTQAVEEKFYESLGGFIQESGGTIISVFLGRNLSEYYIPEYDSSGSYSRAIELYTDSVGQLADYNFYYFVTEGSHLPFKSNNYLTNSKKVNFNAFQDSVSDYPFVWINQSGASTAAVQGNKGNTINIDNFGLYIPTVYDEYVEEFRDLRNELYAANTEESIEMADALNRIIEYVQGTGTYDYDFGFAVKNFNSMPEFLAAYESFIEYTMSDYYNYFALYGLLAVCSVIFLSVVTLALNLSGLLRRFLEFMARLLRRVLLEIKLALWIVVGYMVWVFISILSMRWNEVYIPQIALAIVLALSVLLLAGVLISDLYYNKRTAFENRLWSKLTALYSKYEQKLPFVKRIYMRLGLFILVCGAAIISLFFAYRGYGDYIFLAAAVILLSAALAVFGNKMASLARDLDIAGKKLQEICSGNLQNRLAVPQKSDMGQIVGWLDSLQYTIEQEIQERIKSERLKVELITNVSHDLKTPLTSIINYIKLLEDENLKPEEANDYVQVLRKKVDRLKTLTSDLFDVAKANSGEMEFVRETIELGDLVGQTLAENQKGIDESRLQFRVNNPQKVYIEADGQKMYRIIENIIVNAIKYSMFGTRVYIDILEQAGTAILTVKNIANYEMKFDPEEIFERFKRGDEARSTDGSGLGLSIVNSFIEMMGGSFLVELDGDLFKAIVTFPSVQKPRPNEEYADSKEIDSMV